MTQSLHFTDLDLERIELDWTAWWAGELNRPMVVIEKPVFARSPEELSREFLLENPVDEVLEYYQSRIEDKQIFGDAWPRWWPFFGAGVVAAFIGAEVHCSPEAEMVWFELDHSLMTGVNSFTYDSENIWWKRIIDAGKLCQLYVSAEDALTIVNELGGRGFAFYITDTMKPENAESLFRDLTSVNNY